VLRRYLHSTGAQVGFTRVVTDHATFAYLCDVYVLEEHQGHGLGKAMVRAALAHPALSGARRVMLATRDAHGLYRQNGFVETTGNTNLMEIVRPDIYSR
jgi:GNAT superfamily N-acetyltransferase